MNRPRNTPKSEMPGVVRFHELSSYLIGVVVEADLADAYLQRVRAEPFGARIDELLELFARLQVISTNLEQDFRQEIVESSEFGVLAQQITLLWYTSAFAEAGAWKFGPPEHYFRSHIWSVIGAHPPALSGGYFGYWKYPPEN